MSFAAIHIPDFIVQAVVRGEFFRCTWAGKRWPLWKARRRLWSVVAANRQRFANRDRIGDGEIASGAIYRGGNSPSLARARKKRRTKLCWTWAGRFRRAWKIPRRTPSSWISRGWELCSARKKKSPQELAKRSASLGLSAHIAVAGSIEVAILAARGLAGVTLIAPGEEAKRLGVLPVGTLLPSPEILETLARWGVETCGALAALPVIQLSERLGQEGVRLHTLGARGICAFADAGQAV